MIIFSYDERLTWRESGTFGHEGVPSDIRQVFCLFLVATIEAHKQNSVFALFLLSDPLKFLYFHKIARLPQCDSSRKHCREKTG